MKARIKETGEIVNLASYAVITLDKCDSWGNPIELKPEEVELIDENEIHLDCEGCLPLPTLSSVTDKCVIFPKGKTTWEGFIPPSVFKVGDRIRNKKSKKQHTVTKMHQDCYEVDDRYIVTFENQNNYELVPDKPNKFDITTLVPFESKVLVRHDRDNKWCGSFFSHIDEDFHSHCYKFVTTAGKSYPMCIPYEGNQHLLGNTNDCDEYYKTWE